MTLRFKVFIIVGTVLVSFFFLVSQSLSYFIARDFSLLEKQEVERNAFRVVDALESRISELSVKLSDWSQWDDTYFFIQDQNEEYIASNLQNESLSLLRIDTVVIMDLEGQVIFKKHVQDNQEGAVSDVFLSHLLSDVTKGHISREEKEGHGEIIMLPEGPLVYVARPVTSGNGLSPVNGYIAFGYFLNQGVIDEISRVTHLKIQPVLYNDQSMNGEFSFLWKQFSNEKRFFIETPKDDQQIVGNVFFSDIDGQPVFFLRVLLDRDIYRNGQEGIHLFQRGMVAAIVVFSALFFFLLDRLVLRRLSHLSRQVEKIGSSSDSQGEVFLEGKDEISGLAHQINAMLSALRTIEMNRKESEKRFRTLADSAPVLIWMTDSTNQCIYVNRGWLDYTGRSLEEELGAGFLENIYLDDARRVIDVYEKAFSQQQGLSVEFRLKRKDESYGWVFSRAIPHFTANNVFLGYIGSCVDITERKEAENQNKKRIEEIEKINRVMVERELKMIELKEQIRKLQGHA